ncbi:GSCFA domain-containing protein [Pseudoroseicyclus tamaricis]|uniref:GSCFA family protein n=1 Tax=Pseudoroseicyclus tamaricis TaxID=2705421 RepID=A0A6B2JYZ6_9RHOB|nr:GSCFA domain-containing protein [Pseudoroseicyclus tamaricis]NDV01514.1 GSCFA family protein [Pseudoroseicyclus tamaricis]
MSNIETLTATEAMARARTNPLRRFPAPDRDGERLYPLASPSCAPSFEIARSDSVFAIGSCFARNIERALDEAGMRVLSREFSLGEVGESLDDAANFFNKYSIHSVLNEITWALERERFPGRDILYPGAKGTWFDAQLGMARLDFPPEEILAFRHRYLDGLKAVVEADVVILTLGYVETWYDRALGLYLNVMPPMQAIRAEPERFEFRVLSYRDVLEGLEQLHALLCRHRTKPLKMLVTVSPVPLLATFRDMDVLVANAYSKSVQRAALDEFLIGKAGVDYFPSYEFVTLSSPEVAWSRNDYRHVAPELVDRIMSNVLTRYLPGGAEADPGAVTGEGLVSSAKMLSRLEKYDDVLALMEANRALADGSAEALILEATAARRIDALETAWTALTKATEIDPARPDALERMITLCRPLRRPGEAKALMARHVEDFPERSEFRQRVTWL